MAVIPPKPHPCPPSLLAFNCGCGVTEIATYVAVTVTALAGIVTVVVDEVLLANAEVVPVQAKNACPAGAAVATIVCAVPAGYAPPPVPPFTIRT